jgi:serine/threonine protein phosphatase 1
MKYFVCADIHGCWAALKNAVNKYGYVEGDSNHQLIVCGDSFGRAASCREDVINVYEYLTSPMHENPPIVLRGNHENIILDAIKRGYCTYLDCRNGEDKTIAALAGTMQFEARTPGVMQKVAANYPEFEQWLRNLPYYFETKNHVFVHGWIPRDDDMQWFREATEEEWIFATWVETDRKIAYMPENGYEKTLVFGHWGTWLLRGADWQDDDAHGMWVDERRKLVGLDNTTCVSHKIEMYVIDDEPVE